MQLCLKAGGRFFILRHVRVGSDVLQEGKLLLRRLAQERSRPSVAHSYFPESLPFWFFQIDRGPRPWSLCWFLRNPLECKHVRTSDPSPACFGVSTRQSAIRLRAKSVAQENYTGARSTPNALNASKFGVRADSCEIQRQERIGWRHKILPTMDKTNDQR